MTREIYNTAQDSGVTFKESSGEVYLDRQSFTVYLVMHCAAACDPSVMR